ncbi:hypothetical protein BGZ65_007524 [Modicella reniformis]|uniref:Uncharacterized protein n=1 Tax=Modicella reniformis TaxID=1440133 RepID=A0A9P6MFD6_9FUNG|nr:hypothetical protein BGZ65_007524 [Modicella reniformis]
MTSPPLPMPRPDSYYYTASDPVFLDKEQFYIPVVLLILAGVYLIRQQKHVAPPPPGYSESPIYQKSRKKPNSPQVTNNNIIGRTIRVTHAKLFEDQMPQLFLIAPPQDTNPFSVKGSHKALRILAPCQGPSIAEEGGQDKEEDLIHLTNHEGFIINGLLNKSKDVICFLNAIAAYRCMGAAKAGRSHGYLRTQPDTDLLHRHRRQVHLQNHVDEEVQVYSKQWVVDKHQVAAMNTLFQTAGIKNNSNDNMKFGLRPISIKKTTKWVCTDCYQLLSQGKTILTDHLVSLDEYAHLARRTTEAEVTLRCSTSVALFTKTILKKPQLRKVILHIESGYFQTLERQQGALYTDIQNQFIELGKALQVQPLRRMEIRGDDECGAVFAAGLQHVLQCSGLKYLHVTGMPHFLQGEEEHPKVFTTCKLKELMLDGVHLNTKKAATHLAQLLGANSDLRVLRLSRTRLTLEAITVLESDEALKRRFAKLSHLNISNNDFGPQTGSSLVAMALQGKLLDRLDLTNNRGMGDTGCRHVLELLRFRNYRRLEAILTEGTGIKDETFAELEKFNNRHRPASFWRRFSSSITKHSVLVFCSSV